MGEILMTEASLKRWKQKNKDKLRKYEKTTQRKARVKARRIIIPFGEKCAVCKTKLAMERHHPDYRSPYEVMYVCRNCHRKL